MAWLELHQTLPTDRKTLRLKGLLKIKTPQAVGHVCMLWLWALDNAQDGDVSALSPEELAEVTEWHGKDPLKFLEAMINAGFIDKDLQLEGWAEHTGRLMEKREQQREQARLRKQRQRQKEIACHGNVTRDTCDGEEDMSRDVTPLQYSTEQYSTRQYSIVKNRTDSIGQKNTEGEDCPSCLPEKDETMERFVMANLRLGHPLTENMRIYAEEHGIALDSALEGGR